MPRLREKMPCARLPVRRELLAGHGLPPRHGAARRACAEGLLRRARRPHGCRAVSEARLKVHAGLRLLGNVDGQERRRRRERATYSCSVTISPSSRVLRGTTGWLSAKSMTFLRYCLSVRTAFSARLNCFAFTYPGRPSRSSRHSTPRTSMCAGSDPVRRTDNRAYKRRDRPARRSRRQSCQGNSRRLSRSGDPTHSGCRCQRGRRPARQNTCSKTPSTPPI